MPAAGSNWQPVSRSDHREEPALRLLHPLRHGRGPVDSDSGYNLPHVEFVLVR